MRNKVIYFFLGLIIVALNGCASVKPVEPWQKGYLAKPEMSFDPDSAESGFRQHIYFSKEGTGGGYGVGGGGCGCN